MSAPDARCLAEQARARDWLAQRPGVRGLKIWADDWVKEEVLVSSLPKPYYEHKGIVIYHADCRDILPHLPKVDLVLTDPPYGVGKKYASHEDTNNALLSLVSDSIPMLWKLSMRMLITPGIGNVWNYPKADWILCWWKPNAMTRSAVANANIWEPVLVYGCKGFGVDGVVVNISPQKIEHPCPKPVKLFAWLISRATTQNALILDPFMGSGTTLVAAKQLGRRAIGIEICEAYCKIAVDRLRQEMLFTPDEPEAHPENGELFPAPGPSRDDAAEGVA